MNNIILNISDDLFFIAILAILLVVSIRMALNSSGMWKALGMITSGLFLGMISAILMDYIHSGQVNSGITNLIILSYSIIGVLGISGIIIFIAGMIYMFKKDDKG